MSRRAPGGHCIGGWHPGFLEFDRTQNLHLNLEDKPRAARLSTGIPTVAMDNSERGACRPPLVYVIEKGNAGPFAVREVEARQVRVPYAFALPPVFQNQRADLAGAE
jgi:hypothetical protein